MTQWHGYEFDWTWFMTVCGLIALVALAIIWGVLDWSRHGHGFGGRERPHAPS